MIRPALAALLLAAPAAAQPADIAPARTGPLTDAALRMLHGPPAARVIEMVHPDTRAEAAGFDLAADWAAATGAFGAPAEIRILRDTFYPAADGNPDLVAIDFLVLYEAGALLCGYAIWEGTADGPRMRRFQYGTAGVDVLRSPEPGRSDALRSLGCTVFPDDIPGGPLR